MWQAAHDIKVRNDGDLDQAGHSEGVRSGGIVDRF